MRDIREFTTNAQAPENWKRYVMYGSFAAAAVLLFTGRRPAGFAAAGIGLAVLAAEHPDKFEEIWNRAPEYLDKGQRLVHGFGGIVDKIAEQTSRFQSSRRGGMEHDYLT
jgi:hypothetical protein